MPSTLAEITLLAVTWVGVAAAAVFVTTLAVMLMRRRLTAALIMIALVGVASGIAYLWIAYSQEGERRALESRLLALQAAAWAPASPLACLEAADELDLAAACEDALFANPQTVAAAVAFTSARVAWLRDARAFARDDSSFEATIRPLQAALAQDRFGFVAQTLKDHYGCTAEACALLALFGEASTLRANLREDPLSKRIAMHKNAWLAEPEPTPAARNPATTASGDAPRQSRYPPLPPDFTLPSADSIPPISIMTPEPGSTTGTTQQPAAQTAPQPASRPAAPAFGPTLASPQSPRPSATAPAPAPAPPMQLGPADRP